MDISIRTRYMREQVDGRTFGYAVETFGHVRSHYIVAGPFMLRWRS